MAAVASNPENPNAAMTAVIVVPILAPTVKGYSCHKENFPDAASGTASEVVVVEDCTMTVMSNPEKIPDSGPRPMALWNVFSTFPTSKILSMLEMNLITSKIRATPMTIMAMPAPTGGSTAMAPAEMRFATGSVMAVTTLPNAVKIVAIMPPSEPVVRPANQVPIRSRMPKAHSSGKKMATDSKLYISWTEAAEKARRNWLRSPAAPKDTNVEVMVVRTLPPGRIGIAVAKGSPPATMPTTMEVVVDEDCVNTVARMPITSPMTGFCANAKISSARPPVATPKPEPMTLTAVIKRYTATTTETHSRIFRVRWVIGNRSRKPGR